MPRSVPDVPGWFRWGVRRLLYPEQCVMCGEFLTDTVRRRPFEAFCSEECHDEWLDVTAY